MSFTLQICFSKMWHLEVHFFTCLSFNVISSEKQRNGYLAATGEQTKWNIHLGRPHFTEPEAKKSLIITHFPILLFYLMQANVEDEDLFTRIWQHYFCLLQTNKMLDYSAQNSQWRSTNIHIRFFSSIDSTYRDTQENHVIFVGTFSCCCPDTWFSFHIFFPFEMCISTMKQKGANITCYINT